MHMKKLLLLLLVGCCFSFISKAAETKLFTGDTTPSLFSRMDMVSWDMANIVTNGTYVNFGTATEPAFARTTVNPEKTGLNASDNALQLSSLKGKSWWPDFLNLDLTDAITITEANRYLHFYHFRENLNSGFSVNINKETPWEDPDKGTKRFDMDLSKAGTWEDVVVDLKWFMDNSEALSKICILMDRNWGGGAEAATNYYFDEIVLNSSKLPRGINLYTESEMLFFPGNTDSYAKWVKSLDLQNAANTSEILANPFTSEMATLNSESTLKFNKSADAAWWQGPRFVLSGTMPVGVGGVPSYLHVMVNIPEMEAGKDYYVVQLNAKDFMGNQIDSGDAIKYWAEDKGKWVDCVLDVSSLGYLSELTVRYDIRRNDQDALISSPAGVFYLDAVAINASEAQRTEVKAPAAIKQTKLYTGDSTPSLFSRIDMVSWDMANIVTNGTYVNFGTAAEPAFARTTVNPVKTGLNTTDNAIQLSSLKGKSWWPDFLNLDLTDAITITEENRFLHFYHYRENLNAGFSVNINKETPWEDPDKGTKRFDMDLSKAGTWEDVVVDLKWFMDNSEPLSKICILMDRNWGGGAESATNYYFDEIVLNNSKLPRGITLYTEKEMLFYPGISSTYTKWVKSLDLQNAENSSEIVANPFTSELSVLNTASIMKFNKSGNAAWWQGPRFVLTGTMPVGVSGVPSYLHVMVNIPEMEAGKDYYVVQLNAKDFMGNQIDSGDAIKYWADDKGKWIDCVLDVSSLGFVSELTVRFDIRRNDQDALINSPAGVFYLDAAAINASDVQRTVVDAPTKIANINKDKTKIYSWNQSILVEGNVTTIEVYSLVGSLVKRVPANGSRTEIPISKSGVYLVRTVSVNKNVFTSKVIVY
jgi:uncharacterized protein YneR